MHLPTMLHFSTMYDMMRGGALQISKAKQTPLNDKERSEVNPCSSVMQTKEYGLACDNFMILV